MSDTESKLKRSKRRFKNETVSHRQASIAKMHGVEVQEEHRFVKHHAMNCGSPGCMLCSNPRKIFKEDTIQEKSFKQSKYYDEE